MDGVDLAGIGVLTAFGAGLISFLSPCVLPLVPGYLSVVTGISLPELGEASWRRVLPPALLFCATFSAIFIVIFGLPASLLGEALRENRDTLTTIGGVLIIALGILFLLSSSGRFARDWHIDALMSRAGKGGPVVAGAAFALAWTPCIGPTLGSILVLAGAETSPVEGVALLAIYSAGLAIPFLVAAIAFTQSHHALRRSQAPLQRRHRSRRSDPDRDGRADGERRVHHAEPGGPAADARVRARSLRLDL